MCDGNLAMANSLEYNSDEDEVKEPINPDDEVRVRPYISDNDDILFAAYEAGFEPSSDSLTTDEEIIEATEFLTNKLIRE